MPIETIEFNGTQYPKFQSTGNAARFCLPYAKELLKGVGFDIGCNREEWCLPGAISIDPLLDNRFDAYKLPDWYAGEHTAIVDYIASSHCLEHLPNWVDALDYWTTRIKSGGVLFLYLPDYSQEYWRSWNNRKHIHCFEPKIIHDYLTATGRYRNIFISGVDLNNSFIAIAEKI